jgi:cytochrome c-type biogenesis protein CcmF
VEVKYIGEHLWAGYLGNAFIVLSFIASLLSFLFFKLSVKNSAYIRAARISFNIHGASVIGIAGTLFIMLFNHFYEYQYVWQHSNNAMPMRYIFSCFWEGQEGSFLLWTFWNMVLGMILKKQLKGGEWEAPVMCIFSLTQIFLASMLLGIYAFDYKIGNTSLLELLGFDASNYKLGSNPFLLLREHDQFKDLPFVKSANYLAHLDGKGLNTLLQNYWMTIHPPTLFLGFASTLIPFTFAIAALWNKKYSEWQKIALPWTYFGILVLGVGILMGGAWAYEALNFGGFWAWDPVENSSLVPWLVLVAAGHTMLVNKSKGGSLFTTHFLAIMAFLLVLYSTFLTRSGVLGNASVHSFTDLGMTGQLVMYVLTFIFISVMLLINNKLFRVSYIMLSLLIYAAAIIFGYKKILLMVWLSGSVIVTGVCYGLYFPKEKQEEEIFSREFWIFLGALNLLVISFIITYYTSKPVSNQLFNTNHAPYKASDYNMMVIPFTIPLLFLLAGSLLLKYKTSDTRKFLKSLMWPAIIAVAFGFICTVPLYFIKAEIKTALGFYNLLCHTFLFIFCLFALLTNSSYIVSVFKGKIAKSGSAIAHIGFIMVILGALISASKKTVISKNTSDRKVSDLGEGFDDKSSIFLTKGDTLPMGPYLVSYKGKHRDGKSVYFDVEYFRPGKDNKPEHDFTLSPRILDRSPEPDTRHYLDRDIYTHVTAADLNTNDSLRNDKNAFGEAKNYVGHIGDTIFAGNAFVIIDSLRTNVNKQQYEKNDSLLEVTAVLRAVNQDSKMYFAYPKYVIKSSMVIPKEDVIDALGLKFVFWKINPDDGTIEITMSERIGNQRDFIVMEAYIFPFINILWLGCVVMALGTFIAIVERLRKNRQSMKRAT